MRIGLVLEGGAMRGLYTAGVLDVMLEQRIPVNGILSVSAGALFGVNYVSEQAGRALRYNLKYLKDKRYMGLHSLLTSGNIVNKDFAYYKVPFDLDPFDQEKFAASPIDFYATVTNLETGEAEYIRVDDVFKQMEVLRASSAMPLVSQIVEWEGKKYLDGGIADAIPVEKAKAMGYDRLVVILTRPLDYRKKPSSSRLYSRVYRNYPKFVAKWRTRSQRYNQTVEQIIEQSNKGELFVIRPSRMIPVARLEKNPEKLRQLYQLGIADMHNQMSNLLTYIK